ncbi:MAG: DUF503 domain-containing protein [Deltaproteobacteria bacterium]|nr:DUF503 domain-containing protein [Deltaproteobacteria bacterium]
MVVGVLRLQVYFPASRSLKDKRQGVRRICDRVRHKFNVAVAEVGGLDTWQRSSLGVVVVGNENSHVQSMLDKIAAFIEQLYVGQILEQEQELLHYGEDEALNPGAPHGIPDLDGRGV